jgi:inosine-uridine nucleoside N-ribohydrolase
MARKLILDVDTGTDDAVALLLAALHPELELIAATTVNGNQPVAVCTDNSLRIFDLLGLDIPVFEGAATPLLRDDFPIPRAILHKDGSVHGRELPIPPPRSAKQRRRAVEFLVETYLAATEPITLVPVGPLTNIATAIRLEPRIVERIPQTVIMGGGHAVSNTTPSAEFNVWVDPEAARVVLRAGLRDLVLVPLDATHRALVSSDDCRRLRALGTPAGEAAAAIIERRIAAYDALQPMAVHHSAPVHDALCVAFLVDPTVVSGRPAHVDVETRGELTLGRTVIDAEGGYGHEPNAFVAFDADAPTFVRLLLETFARTGPAGSVASAG